MLTKLISPRTPWTLAQHFWVTSLVAVAGFMVVLFLVSADLRIGPARSGTSPPPAKNPVQIVLDPTTSYSLAPIPMEPR